jgi:outer membrane protein OmpA-like peptidoglycan-associated protein
MPLDWTRNAALLTLATALHAWAPGAAAQTGAAPQPDDIINALRPARQRNLQVRPAPQPEAAAPAAPTQAAPPPAATPAPAPPAAMVVSTPAPAPAPAPAPVYAPAPSKPVNPTPIATTPLAPMEPPPSLSLAIPFEVNSARLRPESGAVLGNLVAALLSPDLKSSRFVIEGHTDASGNPATNLRLSQARADEVRLYLVALGVHPSRLRAVGKGSTEPANGRDPLSADNRRVRVVTLE